MKLRIRNNSIRLRLQRAEIDTLMRVGALQNDLVVGPETTDRLRYGIALSDTPEIGVLHETGVLTVYLPRVMAGKLANTDLVGVEASVPVAEAAILFVFIEKDYHCQVERLDDVDRDAYPNPVEIRSC